MGLNSGSVFGSTFSPFFGMHFIAFFWQNKRKTSKTQFLSCRQAKTALICTRGDNDSSPLCDHKLFLTLWRPLQHLAVCGRGIERQTCQMEPWKLRKQQDYCKTAAIEKKKKKRKLLVCAKSARLES